jgi:multidrug efflux pump subunit AcrB
MYSLSQIILPVGNGTFRVEDAGELYSSTARQESVFIYNGIEAAALEIYRRPGADPLRLSREIKKTLEEASLLFSRDVKIELVRDQAPSLVSGITSLIISAVLAAAAVIFVLFISIRSFRYSLLVSLSIPISIAAGICVLSLTGKSLNSMSLGGIAMGIGLVSDISVIVFDLLHRFLEKKDCVPMPEEIGNKAFSISGSSIASTLTTALVFIPIIMLPGPLGSLFGDIAIALVASVTAGWFYAQFCLPSLYLLLFNSINAKEKNNKVFNRVVCKLKFLNSFFSVFTNGSLVKKYSVFLSSLLRSPKKLFVVAATLSFVGGLTLFFQPMIFINPDEAEEVWVSVHFPPGTLLEATKPLVINTSNIISGLPFVKTVYGRAGAEETDVNRRADIDYRREEFILRCVLEKGIKPEKALSEIKNTLEQFSKQLFTDIPITVYFPKDRAEALLGLSSAFTFVINGKDRGELLERADIVKETFESASASVNFRPQGQRQELRLFPNREISAFLSISAAQIAETLFILNEGVVAAKLEIEGRPLDVRVTGLPLQSGRLSALSDPIQRLEQIPIRTSQGKIVNLGSIGRIVRKEAEASLVRQDRSDVIYVDVESSKNNEKLTRNISTRFSWFLGADESVFIRYRNSLFIYVLLVLILLYMTMGALFESFLLPLILMMTIPFSLAGAGPALLLAGAKIDSGAILGLTALFGLVVNNSLILYEISDQKICKGFSVVSAVKHGAAERLRAILITMATTIFALLPLMLSPMGNSQKSMAAAMLGGLVASTLLSLFAIPPVLIRYFKWRLGSRVNISDSLEVSGDLEYKEE